MRILIIEDEQDVAEFVRKVVTAEGHAVDIAHDGLQGEDMALSESYDLVVLDIMLPGKDGLQVLGTLRHEGLQTPILMLTARGEVRDRVTGLDAGADDYLPKPFAVAELRARVRSLLRRHSATRASVLQAGDLTLNTVTHEVWLNDKLLEFTNREYAVLQYLLQNKNRLLSKGMIAEHVWDFQFSGDYNLIEVYIRRIRNKIESDEKRLIHTIRNGGYVIRDPE